VVAVSPLVRGQVLKGPTAAFMASAGHPLDADGVAAAYRGVIDVLVADLPASAVPTHVADVLMADAEGRRAVAVAALAAAEGPQ
jgi:LPPG:FO 2-phospho-L-lactate transferase